MDKIIYMAIDNGIDGRDPDKILYAAWSKDEIQALLSKDTSKAWRRIDKAIIDDGVAKRQALAKLNGIDRLVLGLPNWLENKFGL